MAIIISIISMQNTKDYDIEERAVNVYIKRLAKNTGIELPISKVAHVQFRKIPHIHRQNYQSRSIE